MIVVVLIVVIGSLVMKVFSGSSWVTATGGSRSSGNHRGDLFTLASKLLPMHCINSALERHRWCSQPVNFKNTH